MFNKIVAGSMTAALLFGGAFQTTADASANADNSQSQSYQQQVYYSINGNEWTELSSDQFSNHLNKYFPQINWNWDKQQNNEEQQKQEEPKQNNEEQQKQEEPKQNNEEQQNQEEPKQNNEEQQKQEESNQDQPEQNQEQPENNDNSEQQQDQSEQQETDKQEEQPAEQPEAQTPQQPAEGQQEQQNQSQSQQLNEFEQQVVELTNEERTAQGLEPLEVDTELSKVAREKSRDMAENNYFSHDSPNYGSPFDMMKQYGISYQTAGENIAKGQQTPEQVVNGWMESEGHRENIMNPNFTHIGVGYVEQGNHWTQQFIGK
ncbi:uncharacterized protein, YkwD family [Lentibacillus halodurans]|uniref:Uncharacterized protein, YkwD family n=1 Tax=Lentibacillus halodurans TaxID=237679 RepID=A0A1I0YSZ8_9BACI|nr:CAP domain-containing protein [Lentibacillus halodurans]SFB16331.1 uncharacterized protein, YkwD family [Lentibacillus halodurans]